MEKHSVSIRGHRTSFSLEPEFWAHVKKAAKNRGFSTARLVTMIDDQRDPEQNLSSALRVFVLQQLEARLQELTPDETP